MARFARVIALGVPHHITQRGNARHFILQSDVDRKVYLDLLRQSLELHDVEMVGYCLMSNHVHLVAIPNKANALAVSLKETHGRFASYWNGIHSSSGHVWQGRYYSCPLDESHLWEALRYTELNPVRAATVARPEAWPWSSAPVHCDRLWQIHFWRWNSGGVDGLRTAGENIFVPANPQPSWLRFVTIPTPAGRWGQKNLHERLKGKPSGASACRSADPSERPT